VNLRRRHPEVTDAEPRRTCPPSIRPGTRWP
jgi:hypothetical protein